MLFSQRHFVRKSFSAPLCNFLYVLLLLILAGCSGLTDKTTICYLPTTDLKTTDSLPAPAFLVENSSKSYNRIGTPAATLTDCGEEKIFVNPATPAVFVGENEFTADHGHYRNRIYRIHFPEVPLNFPMVNLATGRNPGLLVIYTFNNLKQLLLVTTVHTCGCYLAFFPTDYLDASSYPPDWPNQNQWIYGYNLPSRIPLTETENALLLFTLGDQTHRITNVRLMPARSQLCNGGRMDLPEKPIASLHSLPLGDKTTSFFHADGSRKGYVKDNTKIFERLLISWWALDIHVGEDKEYGGNSTEPVFYTSLKFWQRRSSDLRNFPQFLRYWGWDL